MPLRIPVSTSSWSENNFSFDGKNYSFEFYFNSRDNRWRFSIYLNGSPIIVGVKIVENQLFLSDYKLVDFNHGDIGCFRTKNDFSEVGFSNLGIGKSYELLYLTNEEIEELNNYNLSNNG